ncbi:hypothetical protein [uncultured Duncaniella sp.]|nr:hypothetical protein [uncultured Duncaniella sp.]
MKSSPPILPYQRSENGWHRLIKGSDLIIIRDNPPVKRGRRRNK